jgi:hypothetical protein
MTSVQARWQITGQYFENCNCDVVCPCLFSPNPQLTSKPTRGACEIGFAFHIDRGTFEGATLDGLNAAILVRTPGPMADGNWSLGLYLDERADEQQRAALQTIFTGGAGGPMGALAPLVSTVLGTKAVPITFRQEGLRRALEIPGVAHWSVQALPSGVPDQEIWASNAHPFAPAVSMASGQAGSTWDDYGMHWDNSGKNGHYAPINWSNA